MDLNAINAFLAVANSGSFSRAGERLFLTQPAISKRIASLEAELGVQLFDRIGRQTSLTEAGRRLLPRAKRLANEIQDVKRSMSNLSGTVAGTLSMATSHHIGLHRLPPVLKAYAKAYSDVRLDIHFMDSEEACRSVEHGSMELGIVTLPLERPVNLKLREIWHDPLQVVVGGDHPLAKISDPNPEDLGRYPAVLPSPGTYTRQILDNALRSRGIAVHVGMSTNYLETLKMLVITGLGWSLLPAIMVDDRLKIVPIQHLDLSRTLGVVTHKRRLLSNAAQAMISHCASGSHSDP